MGLRRLLICLILCSPDASWAQAPKGGTFEKARETAVRLYGERKYFQAIQELETALPRATPQEKAEAQTLLARIKSAVGVELFNAGEGRKAEEAFRASLAHAEDSYAHFGLGFQSFVRLEDDQALSHLLEAARLEPGNSRAQKLLGLLEYRQGRNAAAIKRLRDAVQLDSGDKEARVLLDRWELEAQWTGSFVEKSSGRFLLKADPDVPPGRVEEVAAELEKARKDLVDRLAIPDPRGNSRRRIVVVLYSPARFRKATGTYHWVGGLFDGQLKFPVPGNKADASARAELLDAVRHEMAHWAVREIGPECPNWLNEGLAQYLELGGEKRPEVDRRLREAGPRRLGFQAIPARLWEVDDEALARWTYLAARSFVEYLAERYQPFRLGLCLKAMARERSVERAFELTYGATLSQLDADWWAEVGRGGARR